MSNFYAVDYKDNKLGVLDKNDGVVEYYTTNDIKSILKRGIVINGVTLQEHINPLYTVDGLHVSLAYQRAKKFGKWIVVVLKKGDRYGNALSCCVERDTVVFYDSSVDWSRVEHPYGQFVASYWLSTLLEHTGGLCLDAGVSSWVVDEKTMSAICAWLNHVSIRG